MADDDTTTQDGHGTEALSVSAAMALAKGALEGVTVRLVGEVSEVSDKPGYKAVYFTVKDEAASLPCMMWNNRYQGCGCTLRVGMLVELSGRFTLYAAKGRMNFDVFTITLAGEGALRMQVAELARKLEAQGLMSPARKRPIPDLPETIGLVTSPRGAAVHDVLRTLRRRFPLARVLLAGVPVEGASAPQALIEGIRTVTAAGAEVVLVVRGGGSFEDLMPFNDEGLARAIAASSVPVITGIGHEPDTSIADMVADVRASTPTAAAEATAVDVATIAASLASARTALYGALRNVLAELSRRVERISMLPLFKEPTRLYESQAQRIDEAAGRLAQALPAALAQDRRSLETAAATLRNLASVVIVHDADNLAALRKRLGLQGETQMQRFSHELGVAAARLESLSPLNVIARGYAIATDDTGSIIKSVDAVDVGCALNVALSDGSIGCTVDAVEHGDVGLKIQEES